jgi:hypothetical protein
MHVIKGDFLKGLSDPVGVTVAPTNGVITSAGLVMGAGAALALARHQPQLRQALARRIEREGVREGRFWRYGFVAVRLGNRLYGAFQSKLDFRQGGDLELISYSAERLAAWLIEQPRAVVHMAFPGIGLGGLAVDAVQEALTPLEGLGERVRLYTL